MEGAVIHGVIHKYLQEFVADRVGADGWEAARTAAGVPAVSYVTSLAYPDEEIPAILVAVSKTTRVGVNDLVEQFGEYVAPALLERYHVFVEPEWRTLDLVAHTEMVIHRAVRAGDPAADPPRLVTERVDRDAVRVTYTSPRRLCHLAKGIVRGVARHYGDDVVIDDAACMLAGDPACVIVVRAVSAS